MAGDASVSNSNENEVSIDSLTAVPSGLCVWIFGVAWGRGRIRVSLSKGNGNLSRLKSRTTTAIEGGVLKEEVPRNPSHSVVPGG